MLQDENIGQKEFLGIKAFFQRMHLCLYNWQMGYPCCILLRLNVLDSHAKLLALV